MRYELFYLVGASREMELEKIKGEVAQIVTSFEGKFEEKEVEEKRKMAYKTKPETHGIYVAQRFELSEPEKLPEIIAQLNLCGSITRFIITKASELPELMSKEERLAKDGAPKNVQREAPLRKPEPIKKETVPAEKEVIAEPIVKEAPIEKANEVTDKKTPEEKPTEEKGEKKDDEDLDKKLEEILNI